VVLIVGWIVVVAFVAQREAEEAVVIGLVAGPFTNRMSIQHPLIRRTNLPNMNHLAINRCRLHCMALAGLRGRARRVGIPPSSHAFACHGGGWMI